VIELSPDGGERAATAYYSRALTYALKKDSKRAVQDLGKAIQLDPDYKNKARSEANFNLIRKRPDFMKLVGP
jgi:Tfp pilus assembly protein PilF